MKHIQAFKACQIDKLLSNLSFETELCSDAIQTIATKGEELTQVLSNPYSVAFAWAKFIVGVSKQPYKVIPAALALATTFLACNDVSTRNTRVGLMSVCESEAKKRHKAVQHS